MQNPLFWELRAAWIAQQASKFSYSNEWSARRMAATLYEVSHARRRHIALVKAYEAQRPS